MTIGLCVKQLRNYKMIPAMVRYDDEYELNERY